MKIFAENTETVNSLHFNKNYEDRGRSFYDIKTFVSPNILQQTVKSAFRFTIN